MINGGHMLDEVNKLVGITPFIVVPSNELYEMIVEHDAGGCIEDGSSLIVIEIGRDNSVLGVSDDAGEFGAFACCFHNCLDFIVSCGLFEHAGEVNNRNVNGGNAHAHAGQLAVKSGDDLADCLCCTGVLGMMLCAAARPPRQSLREEPSTVSWVAVME